MTQNPDRWQHLEPFIRKLFKERIQRYDEIMSAIRLGKSGKIQTLKCEPSRTSEPIQGEERP
jgi:hypothetical protein